MPCQHRSLFNAKGILVEEKSGLSLKLNVITRLEFEPGSNAAKATKNIPFLICQTSYKGEGLGSNS